MKIIINYKKPIFDESLNIIKFEIYNKYIINNKSIKVGSSDIFDDLENIIIKKNKINTNEISDIKVKYHKKGSVINISNILINENITIYDLKLIIYNITGISIEKQHIEQYINKDQYKNIEYVYENVNLTIYLDTCLNNLLKYDNNQLFNISLDSNLINNRHLYTIKEFTKIKKIKDLDNINNLEIDIFNLDDFITDKAQLHKQLNQDTENLNNIYYGFVEKYYPYYTLDLFSYYLKSDNIWDIYPSLYIEKNKIINKLNELNKLENIKIQKNESKSIISKINIKIPSYNTEKILNIQHLFNIIELQKFKNIHKIKCKININDKKVYLEKINVLDTKFNNNLLENNIENDVISFLITLNNKKFELIDNIITLNVDEYNNIYLTFFPNEEFNLEKSKNIIEYEINKIINELNKMLKINITTLNKYNIKILSLDSNIIINNTKNNITYQQIIKKLQEDEILDYYKILETDENSNKIELRFLYANIKTYINESKLNTLTDNYFIFNLDPYLIEKYKNIVYNSKITIQLRLEDIKINYNNIGLNEYNDINDIFIKLILSSFTKTINKSNVILNTKKIKILKENDPKLFIINKDKNKNLYSRKCQSNKQPIIVQSKDIKTIKNVVKYWNFTKNKSEYYTCNNKKYPYITFLTGLHPNNYCIPCCRKKAVDDIKIFSSYKSIHNKCLNTFKYIKNNVENEQMQSRYIMNYSCKITLDNNRIMELPITLKKIINTKYDITNEDDNSYYIKGIMQNFLNINNVSIMYILSIILEKNVSNLITFISSFLIANPSIINNLLGGKLLNYIKDVKEFVKLLNITFSSDILLKNYKLFDLWNEFFIEISKYFGYVYIIIEETDGDILNDSKLKLIIDSKIKNISDYITNNYKYVILVKRNINKDNHYYPILQLNYKQYYNNNNNFKIAFNYDDLIISKIKYIYKSLIEKQIKTDNISLDLINKFILVNNKYKIIKYFLNKKTEIYSILIQINEKNKYIYLNIDNIILSNISYKDALKSKLYDFTSFKYKSYDINYKNVLQFINDINGFIFKMNKENYTDIFYKNYLNTIILLNKDKKSSDKTIQLNNNMCIKNQYNYLRIQSFIINNNEIIGVICNNLNIYITEHINIKDGINMIETTYERIIKILKSNNLKKSSIEEIITREYNLENNNYKFYIPNEILSINKLEMYKNYFRYYLYNPFSINSIINTKEIIKDARHMNINKALYETNLYNLLTLHIIDIFKKIKNIRIRNKLKLVISNFTKNDINIIIASKSNKKIYDIINNDNMDITTKQKIYANIMIILRNIMNTNTNQSFEKIKEICLNKFSETRFEFDNLYVYDILKLEKQEFIKKIKELLDDNIIYKKPNTNHNIIDLTLCNSTKKSYYCDNNKLIIDNNIYKQLLDIFYYDITNPFKQKLLLNFTNINKDIYKFNNFINEKIYIYY